MQMLLYIAIGILAGVVSGMVGIGGGVIIVPILVFLFGFTQHQAQGTTLAMLIPPIGALAAWNYYKHGYVDVRIAIFLALGFLIGTLPGAKFAQGMNDLVLKKIFGVGLFVVAAKMLFFP